MEATGPRLIIYGDKEAEFSLWNVSDIHLGNKACDKDRLKEDVARIEADPYSLWVLGGDYCDFINYQDPRFDPECIDEDIQVKDLARLASMITARVYDYLKPIAPRCLGVAYGNHEHQYFRRSHQMTVHDWLCSHLDAPNMRYGGFMDLCFEHRPRHRGRPVLVKAPSDECYARAQHTLRVCVHHGFSSAGTTGGKLNALMRGKQQFACDLFMMGHVHEKIAAPKTVLGASRNCRKLKEFNSVGMITGTYLRTYQSGATGYGDMKGYAPTTLGASKASYCPWREELSVSQTVRQTQTI